MVLLIASLAAVYGLRLRHRIWFDTEPIRYTWDIDNGLARGNEARIQRAKLRGAMTVSNSIRVQSSPGNRRW